MKLEHSQNSSNPQNSHSNYIPARSFVLSPELEITTSTASSHGEASQNFDSDLSTKQTQIYETSPYKKALLKGTLSIADLWSAVQENYDSEWRHQEFILACYRAGCLYYASQKYARILNMSPSELIAKKMQGQIEALAMKERLAKPTRESNSNPSRISSFIAIIGLVIAVVGFIGPNFRNLVGVGISIFVMAAGLRHFVSRPN